MIIAFTTLNSQIIKSDQAISFKYIGRVYNLESEILIVS